MGIFQEANHLHSVTDLRIGHGLEQCLSTWCIVHPRVYQNFPGVYHRDGVYQMCAL